MVQFIISMIFALFAGVGVLTILGYFTTKAEQKEFDEWLDMIEKELKEREEKKNGR